MNIIKTLIMRKNIVSKDCMKYNFNQNYIKRDTKCNDLQNYNRTKYN